MKYYLSLIGFIVLFNSFSFGQTNIDCNNHEQIKEKLKTIVELDQSVRKELIDKIHGQNKIELNAETLTLIKKFKSIDKSNQEYISDLLDNCGWPTYLDTTGNSAIFYVIDHSKIDYMDKYYSKVEEATKMGYVDTSDLCVLKDRMLMKTGKKQLYGTQSIKKSDGTILIWPIENPDGIDALRKKMGLPEMSKEIAELENGMGHSVVFDKNLTIEESQAISSKNKQVLQ